MSSKHQHMGEKAEVGNCSIPQQQHVPSPQQSLWCTGWVVCMSAARLWSRSSWSCHIKKVGLPPNFFGLISSSVWITVSFLCSYLDLLSSSPRVFSASAILWEKSLLPTALYPLSFQKKNKIKQNTKKNPKKHQKTPKPCFWDGQREEHSFVWSWIMSVCHSAHVCQPVGKLLPSRVHSSACCIPFTPQDATVGLVLIFPYCDKILSGLLIPFTKYTETS